jgi:hypothetical protein
MSASRMSARAVTRLPVPLLFMALSIGIFALMAVLTFASATAPDGDPAGPGPQPDAGEVLALDAGTPIAHKA